MIRKPMAKLYFSYSTMNAGKSTILLQASYNYRERGMRTLLYTSSLDDRVKKGEIHSRIGIGQEADTLTKIQICMMKLLPHTKKKKLLVCL